MFAKPAGEKFQRMISTVKTHAFSVEAMKIIRIPNATAYRPLLLSRNIQTPAPTNGISSENRLSAVRVAQVALDINVWAELAQLESL